MKTFVIAGMLTTAAFLALIAATPVANATCLVSGVGCYCVDAGLGCPNHGCAASVGPTATNEVGVVCAAGPAGCVVEDVMCTCVSGIPTGNACTRGCLASTGPTEATQIGLVCP
jgi:hypothetical protein